VDPLASYPLDQYHEASCPLVQDRLVACLVSYQASCQEVVLQEGLLSFEPSLLASVLLCLALGTLVLHLASGILVLHLALLELQGSQESKACLVQAARALLEKPCRGAE